MPRSTIRSDLISCLAFRPDFHHQWNHNLSIAVADRIGYHSNQLRYYREPRRPSGLTSIKIPSTGSYPSPTIELNSAGISSIKPPPLDVIVLLNSSMLGAPKTILSGKLLVGLLSWKLRNWISKPSLVGTVEKSHTPALNAALGDVTVMSEKNAADFATSELP